MGQAGQLPPFDPPGSAPFWHNHPLLASSTSAPPPQATKPRRSRHKKYPEIATITRRSRLPQSHLHARPTTHTRIAHCEREMWWERGRCGERKEMRNREEKIKWERERVRYVNKKILFVLQLSYSAILNVESHCSTIANFFCNSSFLQIRMQRLFWAFMLNKSNIWHLAFWMQMLLVN